MSSWIFRYLSLISKYGLLGPQYGPVEVFRGVSTLPGVTLEAKDLIPCPESRRSKKLRTNLVDFSLFTTYIEIWTPGITVWAGEGISWCLEVLRFQSDPYRARRVGILRVVVFIRDESATQVPTAIRLSS